MNSIITVNQRKDICISQNFIKNFFATAWVHSPAWLYVGTPIIHIYLWNSPLLHHLLSYQKESYNSYTNQAGQIRTLACFFIYCWVTVVIICAFWCCNLTVTFGSVSKCHGTSCEYKFIMPGLQCMSRASHLCQWKCSTIRLLGQLFTILGKRFK